MGRNVTSKFLTYSRQEVLTAVTAKASSQTGFPVDDLVAEFFGTGASLRVIVRHRSGVVDVAPTDLATSFRIVGADANYRSVLLLTPADASPDRGDARFFLHNEADGESFREISWKEAMAAYHTIGQAEDLPQSLFCSIEAVLAFLGTRRDGAADVRDRRLARTERARRSG